ncbi:ankyrin repeat domain-containing protein [Sulfurimonas sp. HSL-1716]|uniref:ankyrin repeat domain-containing protein n=1 Tax=Hydrocurvibacter sulfurireducens TaxID=3131937 RepID=UPI0031F7FA6C
MRIVNYFLSLSFFSLVLAGCATNAPLANDTGKRRTMQTEQTSRTAQIAQVTDEYTKYKPFYDAIQQNSLEQFKAAFAADPIDVKTKVHPRGDLLYIALRGTGKQPDKVRRNAIIKYLVEEKKADVNAKETYGFTPLHAASDFETAKYLVEHGADVNAKTDAGLTPLQSSLWANDLDLTTYLLNKGVDIDAQDVNGVDALYSASYYGNVPLMKLLVEHGAKIESSTKESWTPLLVSAYNGQLDAVKFLIEKGANIEARNSVGWTPLLLASAQGKTEVARYLLQKGAKLDAKTFDGQMPLYVAARYGHLDLVKLFLDEGADIDSLNYNGMTPLHVAAMMGQTDVLKYLLENGANPDAKDFQTKTPMAYAIQNKHSNLISYIQNAKYNYASTKEIAKKKRFKKLEEKLRKNVNEYIAKNDLQGLKTYTDRHPNAVNFIPDDTLRLALTGPKGMKVGDIRKLIQSGKNEKLVISLINRTKTPYKEFTLKEIDILSKMGISDNIISAMIDITTKLQNDADMKEEQRKFLQAQKDIAKQKSETKVIYQNAPVQKVGTREDPMMEQLQHEVIKQGVNKLLDRLF